MTGQTYSRKVDIDCLSNLASLGATVHKVRLQKLETHRQMSPFSGVLMEVGLSVQHCDNPAPFTLNISHELAEAHF